MKKIPKMISTKDLSYITDMFNWNMILVKKLEFYINDVQDEIVAGAFDNLIMLHKKHCEELIDMLGGK